MQFIKDVTEVYEEWEKSEVLFVDCRFDLKESDKGKKEYLEDHLPGAVYFDLEKDLSAEVKRTGGRHPLPDLDTFIGKLEQAGIDENTTVVAYDNGHPFAARFCWLLRFLGHTRTFLLNGGYEAWKQSGYPLETDVKTRKETTFQGNIQRNLVADQEMVKESLFDKKIALIDSRAYQRFAGKLEPIDAKAGHIPGAKNYEWMQLFTKEGLWKELEDLQKHFSRLKSFDEIIVYCGSGVTATPNVIGLWEAGFSNVKLYVGSWSDWISNPGNRIETV
jgi:thiosulfate/3-mercaptopyruvate sulfurtransferase